MPKILKCGDILPSMFFPFIAPIFCFGESFFQYYLKKKWDMHTSLFLFFLFLGEVICGIILHLIFLCYNPNLSTKKTPKKHKNSKITLVPSNHDHLNRSNYFIILIPGFIYVTSSFLIFYNVAFFPYQISKATGIFLQILFSTFLCIQFLSYNYYQHNFWAFCIIIVGFVFTILVNSHLFLGELHCNHLTFNLILYFLSYCLFTTAEVIDKWLMETKFIPPHLLLLIEGFTGLTVSLCLICFLSTKQCDGVFLDWGFCNESFQKEQIESFYNFLVLFNEQNDLLLFLSIMICNALFKVFSKYTVYHYSPTHRTVSDLLSCFLTLVFIEFVYKLYGILLYEQIAYVIGFIIIVFGSLMYNEFIICGLFGLDENTKININIRKLNEEAILNKDLNAIESTQDINNSNFNSDDN